MKKTIIAAIFSFALGCVFQNYLDLRNQEKLVERIVTKQEGLTYWSKVSDLSLDVIAEIKDSCDMEFFYEMTELQSFKNLRGYMETCGDEPIECFIGEWLIED